MNLDFNCFKVIRCCNTEYETKIHEALFTKKHNPELTGVARNFDWRKGPN